MITYISIPYSVEHLSTQNSAIKTLNKYLATFYKRNPNMAGVNTLYSIYNNPLLDPKHKIGYKEVYSTAKILLDSSLALIVLKVPNWDYSDIVMNEISYFSSLNRPILYEDLNELYKTS